jgi:predicted acetyltransferase
MVAALRLRPPRPGDEARGRLAHQELREDGYAFFIDYDPAEPWAEFIDRIDRQRSGNDVPAGRVPAAFLMAWVGDEMVGRTSIRFALNEYLASAGGHIGYAVLPAQRRLGYGTEILRQSLVVARAHGVDAVLLTCAIDNAGSRAVIERCGGQFESIVHDPKEGVEKRRYWIH